MKISKSQLFRKKDISTIISEAGDNNGELKKNLTATNLVTLGIGAIVGTGIFVITGTAAANFAGPALTISFIISALGCVMAGLCYAELSSMMPVAGSVYSYSHITLGEFWAWFIGWILILEYLFSCSSVAVGWSGYMVSLLKEFGLILPPSLSKAALEHTAEGWVLTGSIINFPAVFIVAIVSALLLGGIKQSAKINGVIVVIKVSVILLFIGFGLSYIDTSNWTPYIPENTGEYGHYGISGIFRGAAIVFYAFLGFDALSTAAQETKNPQKDMPKGILISLAICTILYILVTAVLTGIVNYNLLDVDAPIALAIDSTNGKLSWLRPFIKLGAVAGLSSVILVMMLGQSRIYYSISKDGLLPKFFSNISDKRGIPHNATIFASVVTGIIAGLFPLHVLSELVSIGTLIAFTIVCISVLILRKTEPTINRPFKTPFVPFIPILGAIICILQMVSLPSATWKRLIVWIILGVIVYLGYGIKHSKTRIK